MTEIAEMQLLRKGEDNQTLNLNPITAPALIISVTLESGILIPSLRFLICENTGLLRNNRNIHVCVPTTQLFDYLAYYLTVLSCTYILTITPVRWRLHFTEEESEAQRA